MERDGKYEFIWHSSDTVALKKRLTKLNEYEII